MFVFYHKIARQVGMERFFKCESKNLLTIRFCWISLSWNRFVQPFTICLPYTNYIPFSQRVDSMIIRNIEKCLKCIIFFVKSQLIHIPNLAQESSNVTMIWAIWWAKLYVDGGPIITGGRTCLMDAYDNCFPWPDTQVIMATVGVALGEVMVY